VRANQPAESAWWTAAVCGFGGEGTTHRTHPKHTLTLNLVPGIFRSFYVYINEPLGLI
jgi:hypothetical protein